MLEEDCKELCASDILNQCRDECTCSSSKTLTDVLAYARKQQECLKKLYAEYKHLKEYIEKIQDNRNIPDEDEATSRKNYRRRSMGDVPSFMPQFKVMVATNDSGKQLSDFNSTRDGRWNQQTSHSPHPENLEISPRCGPNRDQYLETGQLICDEEDDDKDNGEEGLENNSFMQPNFQRLVPGQFNDQEALSSTNISQFGNSFIDDVSTPLPGLHRIIPGEFMKQIKGIVQQSETEPGSDDTFLCCLVSGQPHEDNSSGFLGAGFVAGPGFAPGDDNFESSHVAQDDPPPGLPGKSSSSEAQGGLASLGSIEPIDSVPSEPRVVTGVSEDDMISASNQIDVQITSVSMQFANTLHVMSQPVSPINDSSSVANTLQQPISEGIGLVSVETYQPTGDDRYGEWESNCEEKKTDLPMELKQMIYKYLKFEDRYNLQAASAAWNEAARDVLVWKSAPLELDIKSDLENVPYVPYLHTIEGNIADGDILFDGLANNVLDLRKMDCVFLKPISLEKFQNFLYSFEKLESIALRSSDPNFLELLEAVSLHPNIICLSLNINSKNECIEVVKNICRIMHSGFLTLTKLAVENHLDDDDALPDELSELCKVKLSQLTDFSFVTDYDYVSKAFNYIFKSAQLESLYISIDNPYAKSVDLDISCMTAIKSLSLYVSKIRSTMMFPENIEYLELGSVCTKKIISKAVNSLPPSVRVLDINNYCGSNLDQQLENIDRLSSLHTVIISGCDSLSVLGVETILKKCAVLCKFEVLNWNKAISFRDETYECLKNSKYLGYVKFFNCVLNPYKFVIAISAMKYLTNVRIVRCSCRKENGSKVDISEDMINIVIEECKFKEPNANIYYCL